jgi:hypothetical protein
MQSTVEDRSQKQRQQQQQQRQRQIMYPGLLSRYTSLKPIWLQQQRQQQQQSLQQKLRTFLL